MTAVFRTTRRIEFADTDMAGIVHFANFFRYMESAEQELLRSRGLSVKLEWQGQALSFPRVSASCDYLRPARFEEVVDVQVRIAQVGRKSITYEFEFSRGGEVLARGRMSSVCCRVRPGDALESVDIPPDFRQRLES